MSISLRVKNFTSYLRISTFDPKIQIRSKVTPETTSMITIGTNNHRQNVKTGLKNSNLKYTFIQYCIH